MFLRVQDLCPRFRHRCPALALEASDIDFDNELAKFELEVSLMDATPAETDLSFMDPTPVEMKPSLMDETTAETEFSFMGEAATHADTVRLATEDAHRRAEVTIVQSSAHNLLKRKVPKQTKQKAGKKRRMRQCLRHQPRMGGLIARHIRLQPQMGTH